MFVRTHRITLTALVAVLALCAWAQAPQLGIGGKAYPAEIPASQVIDPGAVVGGQTAQCTVTLSAIVQEQDQVVSIETDHPEVFSGLPENVVVPVGYDSVTFTLTTVQVSGSVQAIVTSSCGGGQASASLTVNP